MIKIFKIDQKQFNTIAKVIVIVAFTLIVTDFIYRQVAGITYDNRDQCIIYNYMPRWLFLVYEYFFELIMVVIIGVFSGVLINQYITKVKRFFPKNQILAFVYGSIIPVCSCGVLPLIEIMKERVKLRVIITFILAAPLLNPFIIALAFSLMGFKYAIIRILASFILAILGGLLLEWVAKLLNETNIGKYDSCRINCEPTNRDVFGQTLQVTLKMVPYIMIAGVMALSLEWFDPKKHLELLNLGNSWLTMFFMGIIGIPIYICNGGDMFFLKPLLAYTDLSLGSSMVFSLTASSVCITSIVMLTKFIGRKLTTALVLIIFILSYMIGAVLNFLF